MKLRYTKAERLRKQTAEAVLVDTAATSADRMSAVRCLERLESAARRRSQDRPEPASTPEPEPTVDELVSQLEAQKQPLQPIENKGAENDQTAINADTAPTNPSVTPEYLSTPKTAEIAPTEVFCGFCSAVGKWSTRYPVGQADGILLCLDCFGKMLRSDAMNEHAAAQAKAASRDVLAGRGEDPATNDIAALRGINLSDWEKSSRLWQQMDSDKAAEREELIRRAEQNQARKNAELADYISRGGRL